MAYSPSQRPIVAKALRQLSMHKGVSDENRQQLRRLANIQDALIRAQSASADQPDLFNPASLLGESRAVLAQAQAFLTQLLTGTARPSAREVLIALESRHGLGARWGLREAMRHLATDAARTLRDREYLAAMVDGDALDAALNGEGAPNPSVISTIDQLLMASTVYRSTIAFQEMIEFIGRFRVYAPYNNMLVRLQNPACQFFATVKTWAEKFERKPRRDARPMLILAPMRPVLVVYGLDDTEGKALPQKLDEFAAFKGRLDPERLPRLIANAERYRILVEFKPLSRTFAGFARRDDVPPPWKRRIVIHQDLDEASRFGVLCHELAHILLGHLGSDHDAWWPSRVGLDHKTVEIEAEAVAHIVTTREGLNSSSDAYLSDKVEANRSPENGSAVPRTVSADLIAKVAGLIERMTKETLSAPKPRPSAVARA